MCLYSAASIFFRSLSADFHSFCSNESELFCFAFVSIIYREYGEFFGGYCLKCCNCRFIECNRNFQEESVRSTLTRSVNPSIYFLQDIPGSRIYPLVMHLVVCWVLTIQSGNFLFKRFGSYTLHYLYEYRQCYTVYKESIQV